MNSAIVSLVALLLWVTIALQSVHCEDRAFLRDHVVMITQARLIERFWEMGDVGDPEPILREEVTSSQNGTESVSNIHAYRLASDVIMIASSKGKLSNSTLVDIKKWLGSQFKGTPPDLSRFGIDYFQIVIPGFCFQVEGADVKTYTTLAEFSNFDCFVLAAKTIRLNQLANIIARSPLLDTWSTATSHSALEDAYPDSLVRSLSGSDSELVVETLPDGRILAVITPDRSLVSRILNAGDDESRWNLGRSDAVLVLDRWRSSGVSRRVMRIAAGMECVEGYTDDPKEAFRFHSAENIR